MTGGPDVPSDEVGGCPGLRGTWGGGPPPDACLAV